MSWRNIGCNLFLGALVAGCAGSGGVSTMDSSGAPAEVSGAFKISYFRAYPAPRTRKLEPTFRVVMSESWRDRVGDGPRNPLIQAAPGKIFKGFMFDRDMRRMYEFLKKFGIHKLKARDPEEWNFREMNMLAKHPQHTSFIRVITIGSDKWAKSYYYRDQNVGPGSEEEIKERIKIFVKCEAFVSRVVDSNSIQIQTKSRPLFRRPR